MFEVEADDIEDDGDDDDYDPNEPIEIIEVRTSGDMLEEDDDDDGMPDLGDIIGMGGPPQGLIEAMMSDMLQGMGGGGGRVTVT